LTCFCTDENSFILILSLNNFLLKVLTLGLFKMNLFKNYFQKNPIWNYEPARKKKSRNAWMSKSKKFLEKLTLHLQNREWEWEMFRVLKKMAVLKRIVKIEMKWNGEEKHFELLSSMMCFGKQVWRFRSTGSG